MSPSRKRKHDETQTTLSMISVSPLNPVCPFGDPEIDAATGYEKYLSSVLVKQPSSVLVKQPTNPTKHSERKSTELRVAAFDLDWTLIRTLKGNTFAKHKDDWKLWDETVKTKITEIYEAGYVIAIFSNQARIGSGKVKASELTEKVKDVLQVLGIESEAWVFLSTEKRGTFRKPAVGMWELFQYLLQQKHKDTVIDLQNSLYVGDAAGREAVPKGAKKDFHNSDLCFAINIGVQFRTPEAFFLDTKDPRDLVPGTRDCPNIGYDPKVDLKLVDEQEVLEKVKSGAENCELVMCVGPPASGKSSFAAHYFPNYLCANQDTLKTASKVKNFTKEALKAGKSVILDNTHSTAKNRAAFLEIALSYGVPVRCFTFERSKDAVLHINEWRSITPFRERRHIPAIAIHSFYKKYESPTLDEGFRSIVQVPFVLRKGELNGLDLELFSSFLR